MNLKLIAIFGAVAIAFGGIGFYGDDVVAEADLGDNLVTGWFYQTDDPQPDDGEGWEFVDAYNFNTDEDTKTVSIEGDSYTGTIATNELNQTYDGNYTISLEMKGENTGVVFGTPDRWITTGVLHYNGTVWRTSGADWLTYADKNKNHTSDGFTKYVWSIKDNKQVWEGYMELPDGTHQNFWSSSRGPNAPPITHVGICNIKDMETMETQDGEKIVNRHSTSPEMEEGLVCNSVDYTNLDETNELDVEIRNMSIEEGLQDLAP